MADFPRYDQIQQRSVHNAYFKQEQLIDQLLHHHARTFELDLHRWFPPGCPPMPEPNWGVYHTIGEVGGNLCSLGEALQLLRVYHDGDTTHEVVTVHLELKSRSTGEAVGTFDSYNADQLDAKLRTDMGQENIFSPADLLAANPGASSLLDAANRARNSGGWPTLDRLRGKFIFVVHGESEIDLYATATNANSRVCFLMKEALWQADATVLQGQHVVFHGEVENTRAQSLRSRFPGLILRSLQADDAGSFFAAQGSSCNLILTDQVDVHASPWARTHNENMYPFALAGLRGGDAREAPAIRDLTERQQYYVLATHSADIWDQADSFSFAHTRSFPAATGGTRASEDTWSAMVGGASNSTIDGWGKAMLMARDGLHPSARYFAVGRAADDHGLFVQWRERDGGDTFQTQLGDFAYQFGGRDTHLDRESIHWMRLVIRDMQFGSKQLIGYGSIDGRSWRTIGEKVMGGEFAFRGLAACSQMSRHADNPGLEFTFQRLCRNGRFPTGFEVVEVGTAGFSKLELFGERPRRRAVSLTLIDRDDAQVVLSSEQRRGATVLCNADDHTFTWSEVEITSTSTYEAVPVDFQAPVVEWEVGGVLLPLDGEGQRSIGVDQRNVTISYDVDPARRILSLTSRPADGAYSLEVQAHATEAGGSIRVSSARLVFTVSGRRTGFDSSYNNFVKGCLRSHLLKLRVRPNLIVRDRIGPVINPREPVINEGRLEEVIRGLAGQPEAAAQLRELAREVTRSSG